MRTLACIATITLFVATFAATPAAGAEGEETVTCGGTDTGYCTTGEHIFLSYFEHSCVGEEGYTGVIQSTLSHAEGARVFTCVYDRGIVMLARGEGPRPVPGRPFTQVCDAVGVGPWSCYVTKN